MPDEELLAFDIQGWLNPRSVLFLWATSPRLDFAIKCIEHWHLHYRGVAFVWIKCRQDGRPLAAQGVRPSITKPTTEFVLAASSVATGRPMPIHDEAICQTIFAPKQAHSQKPDAVQDRIELLYPSQSKIELFARRTRPGWDSWGDQAAS